MPGINEFLVFNENKNNTLENETYSTDKQRIDGLQAGVARSNLQNKFQRNVSVMTATFGKIIADRGMNAIEEVDELEEALKFTFGNAGGWNVTLINFNVSDWIVDDTLKKYVCTKTINGITSDEEEQLIITIPKIETMDLFMKFGITSYSQSTNSLKFKCKRKPNKLVKCYVVYCYLK